MAAFGSKAPAGTAVAELEVLVRTAIFKPANELVAMLLQQAAERIETAYISKPGEQAKGRETLTVQGMFGTFELTRQYYYHPGKNAATSRPMRPSVWKEPTRRPSRVSSAWKEPINLVIGWFVNSYTIFSFFTAARARWIFSRIACPSAFQT